MEALILRIGLALAIGLVVGIERGWREREAPAGSRTAGIRTFGIAGFLGGIFAAQAQALASPAVFYMGFLGFAAIFAYFKHREAEHDQEFSVTGVFAGMTVFALGGLAVAGDYRVAAAGGVALAGLLASRELLHGLLERLSWVELRSAILLAAMTVIGLSLLPNRTIDPWGGFNPWEIWFFSVLTATISYAGYIAVRVLGPGRGLLLSGIAGAVISSTAVTAAFARRAKDGGPIAALSGGAALAAMVSVLRVLLLVALIAPTVSGLIAPPALAAAAIFCGAGLLLLFRSDRRKGVDAKPGNPFDLGPLLIFAASFAVVATVSAAAVRNLGSESLVVTSALSGIFDVDVATLTAARMASRDVASNVIGEAVLAALAANAVGRLAVAMVLGPLAYSLPLTAATALAAAAGYLAFLVTSPT